MLLLSILLTLSISANAELTTRYENNKGFYLKERDQADLGNSSPEMVQCGAGGAMVGAFVGKALVSLIGHGAITIVALGATVVGGPAAGWATAGALESCFGPYIESASLKGAMAGGIAGAVATGPV